MSETVESIQVRRGRPGGGGNPSRFVELAGGKAVLMLWHEPDPVTARTAYYYNTRQNKLFKKIHSAHPITGKMIYYWKDVTEC